MKVFLMGLAMASLALVTFADPFVNLDFELAETNSVQGDPNVPYLTGSGPTAELLPGWTLTSNGQTRDYMGFNVRPIGGGPEFSIFSAEGAGHSDVDFLSILEGKYAFITQTGPEPGLFSQVGDIPANATELRLLTAKSSATYVRTFLDGTEIINGQTILSANNFNSVSEIVYGDISAFAGKQNVRLDIETGRTTASGFFPTDVAIDRIEFVTGSFDTPLRISKTSPENGQPQELTLQFPTEAGHDYFVEFRDTVNSDRRLWRILPDAPHNSGVVTDLASNPQRFYRVHTVKQVQ